MAGAIGGIFVVRAISDFGHRILMYGTGLSVITNMQRDMVNHLLTLDSAFFHTNPPGTLIERVRGDTTQANQIWMQVLGTAWREVVTVVVLLGVAISVDWRWTLVAVMGVPLLIGPVLTMQRYVRKKALAAREAAARLSTRLDEIFPRGEHDQAEHRRSARGHAICRGRRKLFRTRDEGTDRAGGYSVDHGCGGRHGVCGRRRLRRQRNHRRR